MANALSQCSSIPDLIDYNKSLNISHDKLHFKQSFIDTSGDKIIFNITSLVDRYSDVLNKISKDITLSESEYLKYRFQPKLLSLDMYGTIELWSAILQLNNMVSVTEFTQKKIKLFTMDIFHLLNEIFILESSELKRNKKEIGT